MSSPRPELLVAPCEHAAAEYSVKKWHYSRRMPTPPIIRFGVWEDGCFIGCVLFSRGANNNMLKPYGLTVTEGCELTRVALREHAAPVSQIVSKAIRLLRDSNPGLRLIVSYADPREGHAGGIYQAMNWIYTGQGGEDVRLLLPNGNLLHSRQFSVNGYRTQYGELRKVPTHDDGELIKVPGKHRYLYPLDRAMRKQIAPLAQPYPKRDTRPVNGDTLATSEVGRFDSEPGALIEAEPHGD